MGVLGSGGSEVRGGGKFCSMACWKGSVHGGLQNYCERKVLENP